MEQFIAYFDESGSPDETAAVVVAGFVAEKQQWVEFERNWNDALRDFGVTSLHMRNFAHSQGEYKTWKHDERRRRQFLARLINVIRTRVRHAVADAVMMDEYRTVDKIFYLSEIIKPYAIAGRTCVAKIAGWAKRQNIDEALISYIFEDGATDRGDLIHRLNVDGKTNFSFVKKSGSVALQSADLLAYEHLLTNTKIARGIIDSYDQLRYAMKELDKINADGGKDWGTYTEKDLDALCINMKVPRRPGGAVMNAPGQQLK